MNASWADVNEAGKQRDQHAVKEDDEADGDVPEDLARDFLVHLSRCPS